MTLHKQYLKIKKSLSVVSIGLYSVVLVISLFSNVFMSQVHALTINGGSQCSPNSVIDCGATTTQEVINKYNDTKDYPGVHEIYGDPAYFDITASDIAALNTTAVAGSVDINGNVYVGSTLVATGAITAGRVDGGDNGAGNTKVTYKGVTFFVRTPAYAFLVPTIKAFVVMVNGQFSYAILGPCGNPIIATPVPICLSLTISTDNNTITANVKYKEESGFVFKNVTYQLKDNTTGVITNVTGSNNNFKHTFSTYGSKRISALVNFTVNSTGQTVTTANTLDCVRTVTLASPSTPEYGCTLITVAPDPSETYGAVASSTYYAKDGATFVNVTYYWGDAANDSSVVVNSSDTSASFIYPTYGTYDVSAIYTFDVSGSDKVVTSTNCSAPVTITQITIPMCTLPGLSQYAANSPLCSVVVPPTLTNTGPGGIGFFAMILGIAIVASGGGYFIVTKYRAKKSLDT